MPALAAHDEDDPDDGVVDIINPLAGGRALIVCEHASNHIPDEFDGLGLSDELRDSHIAWDPGALSVARRLAHLLDATLIAHRVSRLVCDCNRPPSSPAAMPERSEMFDVPGNRWIDDLERARRAEKYYEPFHREVSVRLDRLESRSAEPVLVTVHSFTPVYFGKHRKVEIGILHDSDARFAEAMMQELGKADGHLVRRNEPYGPIDGVTHTLIKHAIARGLPNVMIEIRNDLLESPGQREAMAKLIGGALARCMAKGLEKSA